MQLLVSLAYAHLLCRHVFQLDHRHRQTVDKAHQVGPTQLRALGTLPLYGELAHHQKVVSLRALKVHQLHPVAPALAVDFHLYRHTTHQRLVKGAVALDERRVIGLTDLVRHLVQYVGGCVRVQSAQRFAQLAL